MPVTFSASNLDNKTENKTNDDDFSVNNKATAIAVVGIGCRYPGANNPKQLWGNVLSRRREFRKFPDQRLPVYEYYDPDRNTPDKIYTNRAAYIDGFDFDWVNRRIPRKTFLGTDIVQWLALDVAEAALIDAGYTKETVPKDRTGVVVGNTLTGEQSRANSMRLRWPFVRRALLAAANKNNMNASAKRDLVASMEPIYKSVFPEVDEDTLQGGLPNTIAGRVCNYFDLHGGGYNVDGACSSSLLAVCTAANNLMSNEVDIALAGGVDVSLDTFELIGFAKTGALTSGDMNVYDKRGAGFLPGEGCGFVVMKRLEDAERDGDTIYSVLKGWGVSSDGKGGITAPSNNGQALAIKRAYDKAGYSPHELDFIEGHGTGTTVGDRTELEGISIAMHAFGEPENRSCGVTSFKSVVGHTKAAAGVGAFIKAVIATNRRVVPPTAGCEQPNKVFEEMAKCLYPILQGEVRPETGKLRAGVSAMGFGGINSHVTLESAGFPSDKFSQPVDERALLSHSQKSEIYVLSASSLEDLRRSLLELGQIAEDLSLSDLVDLAADMSNKIKQNDAYKASVIACSPDELSERLLSLDELLGERSLNEGEYLEDQQQNIFASYKLNNKRIGFLFPGQGSQQLGMARVIVERYSWARKLIKMADEITEKELGVKLSEYIFRPLDRAVDGEERKKWIAALSNTKIAQPAICLTSLLYIRYLKELGISPAVVGGHSLGELTAFQVAGAFDEETLIRLASLRGKLMAKADKGAMASIATTLETAREIIKNVQGYVEIANINSPRQIVITGDEQAVESAINLAIQQGVDARSLPVSGAFHSEYVSNAASEFKIKSNLSSLNNKNSVSLISSKNGNIVESGIDLAEHFSSQIVSQVNFVGLLTTIQNECDVLFEVGPGRVLSGLVEQNRNRDDYTLCLPLASKPEIDRDLNVVLARSYINGLNVNWKKLYSSRLVRKFVKASDRLFIENPCERPFESIDVDSGLISEVHESSGSIESTLSQVVGVDQNVFSEYFSSRHEFLKDVIKADLHSFSKMRPSLSAALEKQAALATTGSNNVDEVNSQLKEVSPSLELPSIDEKSNVITVEILLKDLVSERTGFPANSLSLDSRLLDDLNLDSIKAGELIAAASKELDLSGQIDASSLANSSLLEISNVFNKFIDDNSASNNVTKKKIDDSNNLVKESKYSLSSVEALLKELVSERTGFPADSISNMSRLLDDLNLDSIKAGELVSTATNKLNISGHVEPSSLANSTLNEISEILLKEINSSNIEVNNNQNRSIANDFSIDVIQKALVTQVADRTGFPVESISMESKLLDDLNLDSIKSGELIASVSNELSVTGEFDPSMLANSSLKEISNAIYQAIGSEATNDSEITSDNSILKVQTVYTVSSIEDILTKFVSERTGYPMQSITADSRLLDDLNLDSIKAGELIASAANEIESVGEVEPSAYANASINEIAQALLPVTVIDESRNGTKVRAEIIDKPEVKKPGKPDGTKTNLSWVRDYVVNYIPKSLVENPENEQKKLWGSSKVLILADSNEMDLASKISNRLVKLGSHTQIIEHFHESNNNPDLLITPSYVVSILSSSQSQIHDEDKLLKDTVERLQGAVSIAMKSISENIAFVQFGNGDFGTGESPSRVEQCCSTGFARTITLERPSMKVRVVDLDSQIDHEDASQLVINELSGDDNFSAAGYDANKNRFIPKAELKQPKSYTIRNNTWSKDDVILVTGGAKGITAECAISLARSTKAKFALIGSSPMPEEYSENSNNEIANTLESFKNENIICKYYSCDISNSEKVNDLIEKIGDELGLVTAVVHGAGLNRPAPVDQVSVDSAISEISPKLMGIKNICNALESTPPKMIVGFSSIIGVTGMLGNSWYAFSNEALAQELRLFSARHPKTSVVSLGYSVWGEAGMGHKLGVIDNLAKSGVGAISTKEGVERFVRLFAHDAGDPLVIVTSNLAGLSTWRQLTSSEDTTQGSRYIESVESNELGVELVTTAKLSLENDLYLKDHNFRGSYLLPTVFGLEAMVQVACQLTSKESCNIEYFENVRLELPITANENSGVEVRVIAKAKEVTEEGLLKVDVGIRTEHTGFSSDHFSATIVFGVRVKGVVETMRMVNKPLVLDAQSDLYGGLLFQGPLFQRMGEIYKLDDEEVVFKTNQISEFKQGDNGFSLSKETALSFGDPFYRDVLLQSAQLVTTPDVVLPVGIGRIELFVNSFSGNESRNVTTKLKYKENRDYVFDVIVTNDQNIIIEKLIDYRVRKLDEYPEKITPSSLSRSAVTDELEFNFLNKWIVKDHLKVIPPVIQLRYVPEMHSMEKESRHKLEIPFVKNACRTALGINDDKLSNIDIRWASTGKPELVGSDVDNMGVSISHDDDYCLVVVGDAEQGCDLEIISRRTKKDWVALLGNSRITLLNSLLEIDQSLDVAGTRIWTAVESARKYSGLVEINLSVDYTDGDVVIFSVSHERLNFSIITSTINLIRGNQRMVALSVSEDNLEKV